MSAMARHIRTAICGSSASRYGNCLEIVRFTDLGYIEDTNDNRNAQVLKALKTYTAKITKTPAAAKRALINEGIYTGDGKLSAKYGGKRKEVVSGN